MRSVIAIVVTVGASSPVFALTQGEIEAKLPAAGYSQIQEVPSGKIKTYFNPLGKAALPVQDTNAFATCP